MFKIGDKVVIIDTDYDSIALQPGNTGVIDRVVIDGEYDMNPLYGVVMDDGFTPLFSIAGSWNFYHEELELVQ